MGKSLHPIRNWSEYNRGLVERGSLTVWMDAVADQLAAGELSCTGVELAPAAAAVGDGVAPVAVP